VLAVGSTLIMLRQFTVVPFWSVTRLAPDQILRPVSAP
jgi:hypothetical protein